MVEFILYLLITLFFTGGMTISGYKTKESWDKWRHVEPLSQAQKNIAGNIASASQPLSEDTTKVDVTKLKIKRAFEDFDKAIDEIASNFPKESDKIANLYNAHGVLGSGEHIQKQMDLSINTKKELDQQLQDLQRKIENALIEGVGKTTLQLAGDRFNDQQEVFVQAQSRCRTLYPLLNDKPKSWEMKALNELRLTKDFDVVNSKQN